MNRVADAVCAAIGASDAPYAAAWLAAARHMTIVHARDAGAKQLPSDLDMYRDRLAPPCHSHFGNVWNKEERPRAPRHSESLSLSLSRRGGAGR